ncbi:hypothetical protein MJO28_013583 [Puccinia striiformis f. sp. tritici]|uniref:Uncharacterized protein n=1 Tax=Puccinia striiformis f. sp. tritici TaxID=168172 RepID=A0ACC0DV73_9BASI|nr:hypothetical protein MJO28_013583 [Puccinia striiformis f. sp. tritici]
MRVWGAIAERWKPGALMLHNPRRKPRWLWAIVNQHQAANRLAILSVNGLAFRSNTEETILPGIKWTVTWTSSVTVPSV